MAARTGGGTAIACLAGGLAAAAALSAAAVADAASSSVPSLVAVVDQRVIRSAPGTLSRSAIDAVGTSDKPLLEATTVGLVLVLGLAVGVLAARRPALGRVLVLAFGILPVACAASLDRVPILGTAVGAAVAVVIGALVLHLLTGASAAGPDPSPAVDRRRFLAGAFGVAGSAGLALVAARHLGGPGTAALQRARVRLPPVPGGTEAVATDLPPVDGLTRLVTANADFFRIDEALVVPSVDVRTWRLGITGMVDAPFQLTLDELLALPQVERVVTLACVSNEVGGKLVGTARWSGVLLSDVLTRAGVQAGATQVVGRSVDGFTVGFPVEAAGGDALIAVGMNGEPLPLDHGFPARLVVPGLYGFVSATKWLKEIHLTTWDAFDAYWVDRGWDERAPVKVQSRIDVPRDYSRVKPGRVAVAGVAWAPGSGIAAVEVRADGGPWQPARLGPSIGVNAWRQWVHEWEAAPGPHLLEVRATTLDGTVQTDVKKSAFPNGAAGHHEINVRAVE